MKVLGLGIGGHNARCLVGFGVCSLGFYARNLAPEINVGMAYGVLNFM